MPDDSRPDRLWLLVTGLLVVTVPALTLVVAYVVLTVTRSVVIGQITLADAVELYLIEAAAFAVFSYLLYRFTLYSVRTGDRVASSGFDAD